MMLAMIILGVVLAAGLAAELIVPLIMAWKERPRSSGDWLTGLSAKHYHPCTTDVFAAFRRAAVGSH